MACDDNARELVRLSESRFSKKSQLDTLWQTISEEFFPERATFTRTRVDGDEYADELYTSLPAQNRRDLAYALGALTRPKNQQWFDPKAQEEERNTDRSKAWFAMTRDVQRTLLYTRRAGFQNTMQMSDNDVISFGNSVVRHNEAHDRSGFLVYLCEHLRDCAWAENSWREVDEMYRKFKLQLKDWETEFPNKKIPERYATIRKKDPHHEIDLLHIVIPAGRHGYEQYSKKKTGHAFKSCYIDPNGCETLREGGYFEFPYTVRRWFLADNSPYACSPASMLGLIEARLLQSQERVIMDAGERIVDPPMIAVRDGVLGRIMNYAGGTTWVDKEYDDTRNGAVRAVESRANIPVGLEMKQDTRQILSACWFLNKLSLPSEKDMTAFEVNERISEYIRSVGPAVEPFETHNAQLLDASFAFNLRIGQFTGGLPVILSNGQPGPGIERVPPELQGADVVYEFDGPIQLAHKRQKLMKARETRQYAFESMSVRPEAADNFNLDKVDRDAVEYMGGEPDWLIPEDDVMAIREQRAKEMQEAKAMEGAANLQAVVDGAAESVPKLAAANQAIPLITGNGAPPALPAPGSA